MNFKLILSVVGGVAVGLAAGAAVVAATLHHDERRSILDMLVASKVCRTHPMNPECAGQGPSIPY